MDGLEFDIRVLPLRDKMFRYARSILQRGDEAEDVTSETLTRLWQRREDLSGCRDVEAFVLTSLRNACYDCLRRRRVRETGDLKGDVFRLAAVDDAESWSDRELVRKAMSCLPARQREVLHLKEIEGYATADIAVLYDIEENQVRVILSRARKALRDEIVKMMDYGTVGRNH